MYDEEKKFVMSEKQKQLYQNDVDTFHKAYTGAKTTELVKSFKDIPIFDYKLSKQNLQSNCNNNKPRNSNKTYVGPSNNNNIKNYANFFGKYYEFC